MKCLVGFQKHLLVKPVTTEGFITRSEKMLFPRKPLSKSTFIVLFIPRHGIYYGLKISTGECPVLEPSQWPAPEETKRGNAESYTGTMVPKQERNVCARRRGSCMELRHTETSVWHFHQYSTSPFARRLLISAYQCHWEAMAAWLYVCNPVELHWRTAVGSVPPAQRHSEPRGILRCRDLATALPSAMAGGWREPTWQPASCWQPCGAAPLGLWRPSSCSSASQPQSRFLCGFAGAPRAEELHWPQASQHPPAQAGQGRPSAAEFCSEHLEERELH